MRPIQGKLCDISLKYWLVSRYRRSHRGGPEDVIEEVSLLLQDRVEISISCREAWLVREWVWRRVGAGIAEQRKFELQNEEYWEGGGG